MSHTVSEHGSQCESHDEPQEGGLLQTTQQTQEPEPCLTLFGIRTKNILIEVLRGIVSDPGPHLGLLDLIPVKLSNQKYCTLYSFVDPYPYPDPHQIERKDLDPDQHQGDKVDTDPEPHQSAKQDPDSDPQ